MFHKSLPSSSLFEGAINSSYRLVGFRSRESVEQFHERMEIRHVARPIRDVGIFAPDRRESVAGRSV